MCIGWIITLPSSDQGLSALVERPNGSPEAKELESGRLLKKLPDDPWGSPICTKTLMVASSCSSLGSDGVEGGEGNAADIRLSEL